jgi:ABC-type uncharacterized transport system substrate-binding protein
MRNPFSLGIILFLSVLFEIVCSPALTASDTIYIVESYNREYAWDRSYREALIDRLGSRFELEWFEMDTKRLQAYAHQNAADEAWQRYLALDPVLVILCDDAALKFLGRRFARVGTPVVFLGINANPRNYLDSIPPNMTGVLERPILKRSIVYINEILPRAKRGLILFDTDLTAQATKDCEFGGKDRISFQDVDIDIKLIVDFESWRKTVLDAKNHYDYIITGLYQTLRESDGSYADPETVIAWTSEHSEVPLFSFWDFGVGGQRTIGGRVLTGRDMGLIASDMALRILSGESPSSIPKVTDTPGKFIFSTSQLRRWGITLPSDILADSTLVE